jgi:signal transduction histidine kinase
MVLQRILRFTGTLVVSLGLITGLSAQDIDSLEKNLMDDNITENKRIEILNQLSLSLTLVNSKRALETTNEAIKLSTSTNDNKGLANAYRNLSIIYFYYDANYSISMEYLQRALDIFENINDSVGIANCYISIGHAYRSLRNWDKEIEYHKKSFEIFTRLKITERIGVTALNLGESYLNSGEFDKSRQLLIYAIKVNDSINKMTTLSTCYRALGMLEFLQKDYQKAEMYFKNVLAISDQLGNNSQKITTIESMIQLASLYKLKGDSGSQLTLLKKAVQFSQKNDLISFQQSIYTELISFYSEINNLAAVKKYLAEYITITDSINSRHLKDRSDQISNIIHVHELEKDKRKLEQFNLMQRERLRRRNMILIIIIGFVSILIWLVLKISRTNRKIIEINQLLKDQREIIEIQRQHLEELNSTKDKFFSIIAHDLRSPLVSLKSFSDLLIEQIDQSSREEMIMMGNQLQTTVDNTIKMTDNLLAWARIQMKDYETRKEVVNIGDIVSDICEFYKEVAEKKGINFNCSVDNTLNVFGDKNQIAFIIRNLINNAIKFTHKNGYVSLITNSLPSGDVQVSVFDNGIGISDDLKENIFTIGKKQSIIGTAGEKGTGLGLILCNEFVKLNGGSLDIESKVGKGTTIKFVLGRSEDKFH